MIVTEKTLARSFKVMILCLLYIDLPKESVLCGRVGTFPTEGCYDATGVLLRKGG